MPDSNEQPRSIMSAIAQVQRSVVVPKDKYNEFGKFNYRSFEDIVAALKKPCEEAGISFFMHDEVVNVGDRYYVKSTVCVFFTDEPGEMFTVSAFAREAEHKNGSDDAQVTGMPAKEQKQPPQQGPFIAHCRSCGTRYQFESSEQYAAFTASPGCCPAPSWEIE